MIGKGSAVNPLDESDIRQLLVQAFAPVRYTNKRVLVIIPDNTRSAPLPLLFRLLYEHLGRWVTQLDYLIALGTHPIMSEAAITQLVGASPAERATNYPKSRVFNHRWDLPGTLQSIGVISSEEMATLSAGLARRETAVTINKIIFAYDELIICGPVFPHEVAGFSGGAKYLFPGIAGPEIINETHWLGALATSMDTIGLRDTAVRRVIHRAAEFVARQCRLTLIALVMKSHHLHGLYVGNYLDAWRAAVDLSAQLNIIYLSRPVHTVLSLPATRYSELWTAAKAIYKTEPVVAEQGEIILYAPHLREISHTHGHLICQVGYHVCDYFLKQSEKFAGIPLAILAHSSHVRGKGIFANGSETPRVQVTLATGIPAAKCNQLNLGYHDPATINPADYANRLEEGVLLVENAGECLYRLR